MAEPFLAEIRIWACNFAPRGWAFCNGQLLPIAQNTALFSLIGTTYGGDGRTTTAVPNLQGRAAVHPGEGPGLTRRRLGEVGGQTDVVLSMNQMPNHNHLANVGLTGLNDDAQGQVIGRATGASIYATSGNLQAMNAQALQPTGGNQSHTNVQPFQAINYTIALVGTYPERSFRRLRPKRRFRSP